MRIHSSSSLLLTAQDQSNANPQERNKAKHKTQSPFNTDFNLRAQDHAQDASNRIQNYECLFPLEEGPKGFQKSKERLGTTKTDIFRIPKTQQCTFSTKLY